MLELEASAHLLMDRGIPLGNSIDVFNRRALHTKIGNLASEAIPVYDVPAPPTAITQLKQFNEITAVPNNVLTLIDTYTVPVSKTLYLDRIRFGGQNIATYFISINASVTDKYYGWWGGGDGLNGVIDYSSASLNGLVLVAGDVLTIQVIHEQPEVSDFHSSIQGALI